MQANGVNYYKGVLLCSRPNQSPSVQRQKPFCGRVNVREQIGLVPTKQYGEHKTRKRQLPVLNNHKKWLEKFKHQIQEKKNQQVQQERKRQEYLQKIKQEGRQRAKQITSGNLSAQPMQQYPEKSAESPQKSQSKPQNPHKKKAKPAWAQTQQQAQQKEQVEVDQLLDFFQKGETEQVKDYMNDDSVKKILAQLKNKIQTLKEQGNQWKNKEMIKIEDQRQQENQDRRKQNQQNDGKDDILSRISKQSGSQSVASQKTVQRVEQLEKKKEAKQWDNKTVSSSKKSSMASVDEQIAKHIADEILRNYPNLKHHSNQSIRKLLEKQAREELKA